LANFVLRDVIDEARGLCRKEHERNAEATARREKRLHAVDSDQSPPIREVRLSDFLLAEKISLVPNVNFRYGEELVSLSKSRVRASNHKR
jgi:hypothetical protein